MSSDTSSDQTPEAGAEIVLSPDRDDPPPDDHTKCENELIDAAASNDAARQPLDLLFTIHIPHLAWQIEQNAHGGDDVIVFRSTAFLKYCASITTPPPASELAHIFKRFAFSHNIHFGRGGALDDARIREQIESKISALRRGAHARSVFMVRIIESIDDRVFLAFSVLGNSAADSSIETSSV